MSNKKNVNLSLDYFYIIITKWVKLTLVSLLYFPAITSIEKQTNKQVKRKQNR